jgi:hypothetical protein
MLCASHLAFEAAAAAEVLEFFLNLPESVAHL